MAASFKVQTVSSNDEEFVILTRSDDSLAEYHMSLLARTAAADSGGGGGGGGEGMEGLNLAAGTICEANLRCLKVYQHLIEQRVCLESLHQAVQHRTRQLDERERRLLLLPAASVMKHQKPSALDEGGGGGGKCAGGNLTDELVRQKAECSRLTRELEQARREAARATAELESDRAKFLKKLEAIAVEQKRFDHLFDFSDRQVEMLASVATAASTHASEDTGGEVKMRQRVGKLDAELRAERTRLLSVDAVNSELRSRLRVLEEQVEEEQYKRAQAESSNDDLQRKVKQMKDTCSDQIRKFEMLEARQAENLKAQENFKRQILEKICVADDNDKIPSRLFHGQQNLRKRLESQQTLLQAAESQVAELRAEVERLTVRERELEQRWVESNRKASECQQVSERYRRETEVQLTHMRGKVASHQEALADYAERMKEKAAVEFDLRNRLRKLATQMAEMQRAASV